MSFTQRPDTDRDAIYGVTTNLALIAAISIALAIIIIFFPAERNYSPGVTFSKVSHSNDDVISEDPGAQGMVQYFFNIRKDNHTNTMNYPAMLSADVADRQMSLMGAKEGRTHAASGVNNLPVFNWHSLGPTNIGGRTRAILIDNNDPSHQTVFAGGVSGGIWKSTTGGSFWDNNDSSLSYSLNDTLSNMNVSCIAQGSDGAIYIGTGEGFNIFDASVGGEMVSQGILGGGIFKSTDDGVTWKLLTATQPTLTDNITTNWAYTNRIACQPNNAAVLYAVNNTGLEISIDSGRTWAYAVKPTGNITYNFDVKMSQDGQVVIAEVGGAAYYCYPTNADNWEDNTFTKVKSAGAGALPNGTRLEFAISPTDHNRIYCSEISNDDGNIGTFDSKSGIYFTQTAGTNGGYWYLIGPGGTPAFDPYSSEGAQDQADYDNTLAVDPFNENILFCGGTTLWKWTANSNPDTIGTWASITYYENVVTPQYIHPDEHAIVFDLKNAGVGYIGCDGGVYKSYDTMHTFAAYNRNYDVTQFYAVAYSPEINLSNQEGVGGGTQDNGSPFMLGNLTYYNNDADELIGGDGGQADFSQINPALAFGCDDYGEQLYRLTSMNTLNPAGANLYTASKGDSLGGDIDSVAASGVGNFVLPMALYENTYDLKNLDSMQYIADANYSIGDTIYPVSNNGLLSFPYILTRPLLKGDTLIVPNRVVSKLATAFTPKAGFWVTGMAANLTDIVVWIPFGGDGLSSGPSNCLNGNAVQCLAWSPDGDALWGGTTNGYLYRFTNMNSIIFNNYGNYTESDYMSGALWYDKPSVGLTPTIAGNKVICTQVTLPVTGRDIMSISIDPQHEDTMIVTLGNYGNTTFIYYTANGLAATPTWQSAQGNLPAMPVYGSVLDIKNGYGLNTWATNSAMVATEHGIYTTNNINAASPTWVKNNSGMANVLTAAVRQQTMSSSICNNSGDIYIGTHGRGIWYSGAANPTGVQPVASNQPALSQLTVYPNPVMSNKGAILNLQFTVSDVQPLSLTVFDINGRQVQTQTLGTLQEGEHLIPLPVNRLTPGTYFISLQGSDYRKVAEFVVVE